MPKRRRRAPQATGPDDKCSTKWCRNKRAKKYTRYKKADGTFVVYENYLTKCWKCRARRLKERHPATYVLNGLRQSAKRRRLPFTLTLDQFKQFCAQTGYLEKRGHEIGKWTIDRKDWNEGYHIWNIQVMTFEDNSAQGADNTPRSERGAATVADDNEPF